MEKKMTDKNQIIKEIRAGETSLGIEFGSTRIKAVLVGKEHAPIASGSYEWENQLVDGIWTYSLEDIWKGLQTSYQELAKDVKEQYGEILTKIGSMGFSAMMHGYMPFDEEDNLLVPFRTWRNNITEQATDVLTPLFGQQIPQRWSIAHLYQAILNGEGHVKDITFFTTLAGYIHWKLTGKKVLGVGDASGMFPIDSETVDYNQKMVEQFDELIKEKGYPWKLREILPQVLSAGEDAGTLTEEGAKLLDVSGNLQPGSLVCPPEGDAGTGMVATNSVRQRTGYVSAGTSVFAMIVLEKALKRVHEEIDMVTTPSGDAVAMVHCNSCCTELDAWVNMFGEFGALMGCDIDKSELYEKLYRNAMNAAPDCGGAVAYGFMSGEPAANVEKGYPAYFRSPEHAPTLGEFFRAQLYSSVGALKMGMDILFDTEKVSAQLFTCHGGLFKVKNAAAQIIADALDTPAAVMTTAGEGGAWGIALLAAYMMTGNGKKLADWLDSTVFGDMEKTVSYPEEKGREGYEKYIAAFRKGLAMYGKE